MKRAALVLLAIVAAASACMPVSGVACANDGDCPSGTACSADGVCGPSTAGLAVAPSAPLAPPPSPRLHPHAPRLLPLPSVASPPPSTSTPTVLAEADSDQDIVDGATPRVLVRADGVVEVYFASTGCNGIRRLTPLDGGEQTLAELTAGCDVGDLDVRRDEAAGVEHIVAHAGDHLVTADYTDDGVATATAIQKSVSESDRGLLPRVAVAPANGVRQVWSTLASTGNVVERQPTGGLVNELGTAEGMALVVEPAGRETLLFVDRHFDAGTAAELTDLHLIRDGTPKNNVVSAQGAIDAVACGNRVLVGHRTDDKLAVTDVSADNAYSSVLVASGLPTDRPDGSDVAMACDASTPYLASIIDGQVHVYRVDAGGVVEVIDPIAGAGAVSLAVVDGVVHLVTVNDDDTVHYVQIGL